MNKLTISHALAQSTKMSLYEDWVSNTIDDTKDIPQCLADLGEVDMSKLTISKLIGKVNIVNLC